MSRGWTWYGIVTGDYRQNAVLGGLDRDRYVAGSAATLRGAPGIAQFLDIGTGLPTAGNVHQVAQDVNRDARVVYVDNDA